MSEKIGLYIHIPFCQNRCSYCDFYKEQSQNVEDEYIDFLIREALFYKEENKIEIDTIYFGGGTPSLLSPEQLSKLFEGLQEIFFFSENCEITLETNPENIEKKKFEEFKNIGVNRVSIGVQTLDDEILSLLSRKIQREEILKKIETIFKIGFNCLSFDIIIGAPLSDSEKTVRDIQTLLYFPFCHASLYILEIHKKTKLYEMAKSGLAILSEEEVADLFKTGGEFLKKNGFEHYEISNFCRKGCECRHNLKYWRGDEYVGLGPSSHSFFRGFRARNPSSIFLWKDALLRGDFPAEEIYKEENKEKLENKIIFGLRLKEGVEISLLDEYCSEGEGDFSKIEKLFEGGFLKKEGSRIFMSEEGFLVSNEVIAFILSDKYRWKSNGEEE